MSKDRDLIFDMTEDPTADNEPLQLGGVGDDAAAAADRQVTTPGDVHVAPQMPAPIDGTLRQFALRVPSVIDECSGIMVFGKRIKSLVFSTDLAIILNVNADAVFAVYPFTPQPVITQALLMASDLPVFVGVGGGLTTGKRVVNLAMYAEMQGATGVVVNAPTPGRILNRIRSSVDVPVVVTVANSDTNYRHRIEDGAAILMVRVTYRDVSDSYDLIYYYADPDTCELYAMDVYSYSTADDSPMGVTQIQYTYDDPDSPAASPFQAVTGGTDYCELSVIVDYMGENQAVYWYPVAHDTQVYFQTAREGVSMKYMVLPSGLQPRPLAQPSPSITQRDEPSGAMRYSPPTLSCTIGIVPSHILPAGSGLPSLPRFSGRPSSG